MKAIGGYFGLETGAVNADYPFLNAVGLNSGRHALEYILSGISPRPLRIHIPYYTCEVVLEPLRRLGVSFSFYHIDENLGISDLPVLHEGEYIIVNNYFGIKDSHIHQLYLHYGDRMIVDCAQSFFAPREGGMKMFFSPRKFIGVADGGYAWPGVVPDIDLPQDYSTDRSIHLLRRIDAGAEAGFREFQRDDETLSSEPVKRMSNLTRSILESTDCKEIIRRRRSNFETLHNALASKNRLCIPDCDSFVCPMVYPLWTDDKSLRQRLIENKIFVATYWPNVFDWCDVDSIEYRMAEHIIPLPIDQRYGEEDMQRIINIIKER